MSACLFPANVGSRYLFDQITAVAGWTVLTGLFLAHRLQNFQDFAAILTNIFINRHFLILRHQIDSRVKNAAKD
jgi:hypothetical protein